MKKCNIYNHIYTYKLYIIIYITGYIYPIHLIFLENPNTTSNVIIDMVRVIHAI